MSQDVLLELSQNPQFRKVVKSLGIPLPMPPKLDRAGGDGYVARPLEGHAVALYSDAESPLAPALLSALETTGARVQVPEGVEIGELSDEAGVHLEALPEGEGEPHALILDAGALTSTEDLDALYEFFHPLIGRIARDGRLLVVGRAPGRAESADEAAASSALEGFVRSVAKEIGRKGATAQLLWVEPGAEARLRGPLRFFLSRHSAYIDGQPLTISARAEGDISAAPLTQALEGKVALVTGAARGIGKATAERLAAEGAHVVCLDLPGDEDALTELASRIGGDSLPVDLTAADAAERVDNFLQARHGGLDILINNAGVTRDKTLKRMKPEQWGMALDVNLRAAQELTGHLVDTGALRAGGRVVCLTSVAAIAGNAGQTNYTTSKSGLIGYVRHLAPELASRGITVNAIARALSRRA